MTGARLPLAALMARAGDGDVRRGVAEAVVRFLTETDVDGLPARVVELTGVPGDVFITHAWVFHSIAANARQTPRMMRSGAIRAA